uniref:Uncharacterized protein n=1 Tax=Trichogramma kaykai TaxID=54128 RepID=A0ABD2VX76_9HYME
MSTWCALKTISDYDRDKDRCRRLEDRFFVVCLLLHLKIKQVYENKGLIILRIDLKILLFERQQCIFGRNVHERFQSESSM